MRVTLYGLPVIGHQADDGYHYQAQVYKDIGNDGRYVCWDAWYWDYSPNGSWYWLGWSDAYYC